MRKITRALGMLHAIPDRAYLKMAYYLELGRRLNLEEPQTFSEKMQWLKLNGALARFSPLADKAKAREYVRRVLGEEALAPALGLYDRAEQIPWQALPKQFVLKCTHGDDRDILCGDKAKLDVRDAQRKLGRWLRRSWYWVGREPVYLGVKPRILVERYPGAPVAYKVMCFQGVPRVIQVHEGQGSARLIGFYDADGKKLKLAERGHGTTKAQALDEAALKGVLAAARALARTVDSPYLRTDFYFAVGQVRFSELALCDSSGFMGLEPEEGDAWLGGMLRLDEMVCPQCGRRMQWRSIEGGKAGDCVQRYDECPGCGHQRMVKLEASS